MKLRARRQSVSPMLVRVFHPLTAAAIEPIGCWVPATGLRGAVLETHTWASALPCWLVWAGRSCDSQSKLCVVWTSELLWAMLRPERFGCFLTLWVPLCFISRPAIGCPLKTLGPSSLALCSLAAVASNQSQSHSCSSGVSFFGQKAHSNRTSNSKNRQHPQLLALVSR